MYTVTMNKSAGNILFGICLALSVFISYKSIGYAGDLSYSGRQPIIWLSVAAFLISIGLVLLGIVVKMKTDKK